VLAGSSVVIAAAIPGSIARAAGTGATAISAGGGASCAVISGGTVRCWGQNDLGQLGNGTTTGPNSCSGLPCSTVARPVKGLTGAAAVSVGDAKACALLTGRTVKCWGDAVYGQLGNGNASGPNICGGVPCSVLPVAVKGLTGVNAISVGGVEDACALVAGGTVKCWGWNNYGQLGIGTYKNSSFPVAVKGLTGATAIAAGGGHTCALITGGTVKCWGLNTSGQLGTGNFKSTTVPVTVKGLTGATAILAGNFYACALITGGTVKCWGDDDYGELGNGSGSEPNTCNAVPCNSNPEAVTGLTGATAVTLGGFHACALVGGAAVDCWGWNKVGQLGNGTTTDSSTPVAVTGLPSPTAMAAGLSHTCALLTGGTVECWGSNFAGSLGNGTTTDSSVPVAVKGL